MIGFHWLLSSGLRAGARTYLESPDNFSGPGKLFFVCRVCIQDQSFNNFENGTMKLSLNEAKLTGFWAGNCGTIQQVLISKFVFEPEKISGRSRNAPQVR